MLEPIPFAGYMEIDNMNKPVAWILENNDEYINITFSYSEMREWEDFLGDNEQIIPLYTHPHPDNLGLAESIIKQQKLKIDSLLENNARLDAEIEVLKSHPVKELNDGGEPVKNATYWKRQYNLMATQNDNLKSGLYHANEQIKYLETHPVKELTDEEIYELADKCRKLANPNVEFARAILRKVQEQ